MKQFKEKLKQSAEKAISLGILALLGYASYEVAKIGMAEQQTFYYHILFILLWLLTAGIGMKVYSIWSLSKSIAEGDDKQLSDMERAAVMRVHSAILIASAVLVFGTVLVYYGKKSDEIPYNYNSDNSANVSKL